MHPVSPDLYSSLSFRKIVWGALTGIIFLYILTRAFRLGITHDEALSYTILLGDTGRLWTANNHWLNTLLSWPLAWMSNYAIWALRLPNVLSFLVYAYFVFLLTGSGKGKWMALLPAWFLLLGNHYFLELFGLFRGYGLALAGCAGAMYYAKQVREKGELKYFRKFQLFALITLYANYAFLYPVLGMTAILIVHFWAQGNTFQGLRNRFQYLFLFSLPALYNLHLLKSREELYFGGEIGILQDTLNSVIRYSFQFELHPMQSTLLQIALAGLGVIAGLQLFYSKSQSLPSQVGYFCLLLPIVLHFLVGMKYPMERSVVYITLLLGLVSYQWLESPPASKLSLKSIALFLPILVFTLATLYGSWYRMNDRYASTWYYDEHNLDALKKIEAMNSRHKEISIGISWVLEPSLNYYKKQQELDWLNPVNRNSPHTGGYDFYFVLEEDTAEIPDKSRLLHFYSDTRMALIEGLSFQQTDTIAPLR